MSPKPTATICDICGSSGDVVRRDTVIGLSHGLAGWIEFLCAACTRIHSLKKGDL
jgi:hypothetical protein